MTEAVEQELSGFTEADEDGVELWYVDHPGDESDEDQS